MKKEFVVNDFDHSGIGINHVSNGCAYRFRRDFSLWSAYSSKDENFTMEYAQLAEEFAREWVKHNEGLICTK